MVYIDICFKLECAICNSPVMGAYDPESQTILAVPCLECLRAKYIEGKADAEAECEKLLGGEQVEAYDNGYKVGFLDGREAVIEEIKDAAVEGDTYSPDWGKLGHKVKFNV